jgi:hypothetical protein
MTKRVYTLLCASVWVVSFAGLFATTIPENTLNHRCLVHGDVLKIDRVRIYYGLRFTPITTYRITTLAENRAFADAKKWLFPNSRKVIEGGCVGNPNKLYRYVFFCQRCRDAEDAWNPNQLQAELAQEPAGH